MFILIRTITYASIFIGSFLIFMPKQILMEVGLNQPESFGTEQLFGFLIGISGAILAISCIVTFALIGKGTPAPFDPPRRLVIRGPYGLVRNPMYIGACFVLSGVALFYQSYEIFLYTGIFFVVSHLFVVYYEEPALKRKFGEAYVSYNQTVNRWWPGKKMIRR